MGTWGHGNLAGDAAQDDLLARTRRVMQTLLERAQSPLSRQADEHTYSQLFVDFEIVFALEKAGLMKSSGTWPAAAGVRALAADYLAGWDAYIDQLGAKEDFKKARRAVIKKTFERFAKLCEKYEGDAPLLK